MYASPIDNNDVATGCMNALAAGSLLYVGIIEMIAADFEDDVDIKVEEKTNGKVKLGMFASLIAGCVSMAVLAMWA